MIEYYLNCGSEWRALESGPNEPTKKAENVIAKQSNDPISRRESVRRSSRDEPAESKGASNDRSEETSTNGVHGCTRRSIRDANNRCTFNHLFELNFEFDKPVGQETQWARSDPDDVQRMRDGRTVLRDRTNDRSANASPDLRDSHNDRESRSEQSKDDRTTSGEDRIEAHKARVESAKSGSRTAAKIDPLLLEWPYFELRVWSIDQWKRKTFVGLALLNLPQKPGQYTENVEIWSLTSDRPKVKLMQHFLGYSLEPKSRLTVSGSRVWMQMICVINSSFFFKLHNRN